MGIIYNEPVAPANINLLNDRNIKINSKPFVYGTAPATIEVMLNLNR